MNKKHYQHPTLHIVNIHIENLLQSGSPAKSVAGNAGFNSSISGGNSEARSRGFDDDWDEE
ncbi:MAG: hypothetical protein J6Z14_00395 [Prevotella sp.]|nr:hypothetical protein [Prevotella sp.]